MLDCCKSLDVVKTIGINIKEFVCLALCNGAEVVQRDTKVTNVVEFRKEVERVCSDALCKQVLVLNYSRQELSQTGDGHFSPIGGYNKKRDLVLIMDVARFKYPPHWAPLELCYRSMKSLDPSTQQCRGWLLLSASLDPKPHVFQSNCCKRNKCPKNLVQYSFTQENLPSKQCIRKIIRYMLQTQIYNLRGQEKFLQLARKSPNKMHEQSREKWHRDIRSVSIYAVSEHEHRTSSGHWPGRNYNVQFIDKCSLVSPVEGEVFSCGSKSDARPGARASFTFEGS